MNSAVENENLRRAADIGITVLLATQPNGPAKVPMYSNLKHAYAFANATRKDGAGAGTFALGESVMTAELSGAAAGVYVDTAQAAVTTAAEHETIRRGVENANKNMQMPSEQAAEDTLASIMANGANALADHSRQSQRREK